MKNRQTALVLCILGGMFGLHHWYLGNPAKGVIYTLSFGGFGFGWMYDIVRIATDTQYVEKYEKKMEEDKIKQINRDIEISERDNTPRCPKCGGIHLTANKKGFSLVKALAGGVVLAPIAGVATGMIGKNKILITCLSCGKQFKPGR